MADESVAEKGCPKKRFRWLKRVVLVFLIILIALAAVWTIWLLVARAQYQAAIEDIRQHNEPVTIAELFSTTLPADQNAAVSLQEAFEAYENNVKPLIQSLEDQIAEDGWEIGENTVPFDALSEQLNLRKAYRKQLQALLKADDVMQAKLAAMQRRNAFAWDINNYNDFTQSLQVFIQSRRIAKYLWTCSIVAHDEGNDALVVKNMETIQDLRRAVASIPSLLSLLVNIALDSLEVGTIEDIASSLRIGSEPGMASREQVQSLIQSLLSEAFYQASFRQAFLGERVYGLALIEDVIHHRLDSKLSNFFNKSFETPVLSTLCLPILFADGAKYQQILNEDVYDVFIIQCSVVSKESFENFDINEFDINTPFFTPFSDGVLSSWQRVKLLYLRDLARRRMAAVALAMRLYEIDHGGWPAKLEDLVPEYLPAVPDDPFLPAGTGKIRYVPAANPPRLYSVGDNGTDEGGEFCPDPTRSSSMDFHKQDNVFFLRENPTHLPVIDPSSISATVEKKDGTAVLSIVKGNAVVYKQIISDEPIFETRVENTALDFNGDGQQEVVIYLWEGQNSGDRILVFGESDGKWSQWVDAYEAHFESKIVKEDNRDNIQVRDPDTEQMKNIYPDVEK